MTSTCSSSHDNKTYFFIEGRPYSNHDFIILEEFEVVTTWNDLYIHVKEKQIAHSNIAHSQSIKIYSLVHVPRGLEHSNLGSFDLQRALD